MLNIGAVLGLNHVLRQQAWARLRLAPFAGRTVEFRLAPLPDLRLTIGPDGLVTAATSETASDLVVAIKPSAIPYALQRNDAVMREVEFTGSTDLAQVAQQLFRELKWDFEENLSRAFGDVVAHRMARTGRELLAWQREAGMRLAQNFTEYWTEEDPLIARHEDIRRFGSEVEHLRDDAERLEKRIERLQRRKER